jgi:5-methyltetrahydrofolate--homocysteine methyltransferase
MERVIYVAGSLGPAGALLKPYGTLDPDEVFENYAEQARLLQNAGVDLLVIETQFDINEASHAVQAVNSVSALPLVCSFSYDRGLRTMMGVKPVQVAEMIGALNVDILGVNCGRSLQENLDALKQLRDNTDLPLWFKPNAGLPKLDSQGNSVYSISPQEMGALVLKSLELDAQVIGGCCGTSPEHLAAIVDAKDSY